MMPIKKPLSVNQQMVSSQLMIQVKQYYHCNYPSILCS
jgi:hypothetical protein